MFRCALGMALKVFSCMAKGLKEETTMATWVKANIEESAKTSSSNIVSLHCIVPFGRVLAVPS